MPKSNHALSRRYFLKTAAAAVGAAALPAAGAAAAPSSAKYTRYNVMSPEGRKVLASYAKGVEAMLKLPPDNPQNWFRNTFIHLMDCPHGNWWFFVWHRGYIGYFEETIRNLSGDSSFALPYWDWTTLPQIPDPMFDGVLTPASRFFEPYISNLAVFTSFVQPALKSYWNSLSSAQREQLSIRGYNEFDDMWNDVTGFSTSQNGGVSGNIAYANTCGSRYLTRDNSKFDKQTAYDVSPFVIESGLKVTDFYNSAIQLSLTSLRTPSHNTPPCGKAAFAVLEGLPHNNVHNYIGGVGAIDPGPYGYMTNFLSPVDPIFFLHHANMDRLWDVWTRKQQSLKLPYLPSGEELDSLSKEPFLFYVNGNGQYVGESHAGDYLSTDRFQYDYQPGFGENMLEPQNAGLRAKHPMAALNAVIKHNQASVAIPSDAIRSHLSSGSGASLVVAVTMPRPSEVSAERDFDVLVGAPSDVDQAGPESPYYAGTIAFFGKMASMGMEGNATFAVPLPKSPEAFHNFAAAANAQVNIRVVPSHNQDENAPVLKAVSVQAL